MIGKIASTVAVVGLAALGWTGTALSADYPDHPVKIIVPYGAGGGTDTAARLVTDQVSKDVGQQFVVDNRPGGGTIIGTREVAQAKPDGYLLGIVDPAFAINPSLYESLPYDTKKDFIPVSLLTTSPLVFVIPSEIPAKTVAEFVDYAKKNPGKLNYGSPGLGSAGHLADEQFVHAAGLKMVHIPYQGGAPAMKDLLANRVAMMMLSTNSVISHIRAGKLTPLAVTGDKRVSLLPDVPTFAEAGYPSVTTQTFAALIAPAGTPKEVVSFLEQAFAKAIENPDVQKRIDELGLVAAGSTSAEYTAYLDKMMGDFKKVIADAGIERRK